MNVTRDFILRNNRFITTNGENIGTLILNVGGSLILKQYAQIGRRSIGVVPFNFYPGNPVNILWNDCLNVYIKCKSLITEINARISTCKDGSIYIYVEDKLKLGPRNVLRSGHIRIDCDGPVYIERDYDIHSFEKDLNLNFNNVAVISGHGTME